ncbi:hypothetical protein EON64_01055 [archaeon]|nr:MAG: hypothetical protein EON64_01055 [archaeon]
MAYRYRKFNLGAIRLITRCELHCYTLRRNEEEFATIHAINEWDPKYASGVNWRQTIDKQRGTLVVTEIKNNAAKFAKWTAQAMLAGAHQMKLGYVSRTAPSNPYEHVVLSMQSFKPKDLASQTNLSVTNMWGIIKMICEVLMAKADGKYVIMKDPNKSVLRIFSVPLSTFEEEEEEEEDEEKLEGVEEEAVEEEVA